MSIGKKIKLKRTEKGLTQKELSKKTNISERTLYSYEQDRITPKSGNLMKIADALEIPVSSLIEDTVAASDPLEMHSVRLGYADGFFQEADEIGKKIRELLNRNNVSYEDKDLFFRKIINIFLISKQDDFEKISSKNKNKY